MYLSERKRGIKRHWRLAGVFLIFRGLPCAAFNLQNRPSECLHCRIPLRHANDPDAIESDDQTRRILLQTSAISAVLLASESAWGAKAELDPETGQLFSPRPEMLKGGSKAARGGVESKMTEMIPLSTVYETRFITYLARFLLNFDPAAKAWWDQQTQNTEYVFAEFAASVRIGLLDYFSGPYGSYSSINAAKAGMTAAYSAKSERVLAKDESIFDRFFRSNRNLSPSEERALNRKRKQYDTKQLERAKQGVLNLYALLKARYTSVEAKRQLAILFSFICTPGIQPVNEIRALLGEADDARVSQIQLRKKPSKYYRATSRRGGGYSPSEVPQIKIEPPMALGDDYATAVARPIMTPTTRVLRIRLLNAGEGYLSAPAVTVSQLGFQRPCQAAAILNTKGSIEEIIVLDPGFGYGGKSGLAAPDVLVEAPPKRKGKPRIKAEAYAEMECEVEAIEVVSSGNGYIASEPPQVNIAPPEEEPDWCIDVQEDPRLRMRPLPELGRMTCGVSELVYQEGTVAYDGKPVRFPYISDTDIDRLENDPLGLLPSSIRPVLQRDENGDQSVYNIPSLDPIPQFVAILPSRYQANDPLFGAIGRTPVTKGAKALTANEYGRLALSGAVCTVVVRTLLNPLELIKTKQQLKSDTELFKFAQTRVLADDAHHKPEFASGQIKGEKSTEASVGTVDLIQSTIALRGWKSLFQSTDITFLASLVFGSFGFGATELFRRYFAVTLNSGSSGGNSEAILLLAAAIATVITAAAAAPFEVLRVRSMGLLESKKWPLVLQGFLVSEHITTVVDFAHFLSRRKRKG